MISFLGPSGYTLSCTHGSGADAPDLGDDACRSDAPDVVANILVNRGIVIPGVSRIFDKPFNAARSPASSRRDLLTVECRGRTRRLSYLRLFNQLAKLGLLPLCEVVFDANEKHGRA